MNHGDFLFLSTGLKNILSIPRMCCRKKKTLDVTYKNRHCTDILCLALFGVFWFVTVIIMVSASKSSDEAAYGLFSFYFPFSPLIV